MPSPSHEILIVADDLTGACDAAVSFAPATICLNGFMPAKVAAYSTESRDISEPEIGNRMRTIAREVGDPRLIFKKIDSTLRGNVRAEIAAAMQAFRCDMAIITPAFPDMGRTVKAGHLHVDGVLRMHAGENVLDAVTNQDLDEIVDTGLQQPGRILWAGSGGLAAALSRRLHGGLKPCPAPPIQGPVVFCIGSDHPSTLAQLSDLNRHRPDARILPITRGQTLPDDILNGLTGAAALFITGGDTASMVMSAIHADSIIVKHQVVTGVPWGLLSGGPFDGFPVVTKSGGFGAPDTMIRVADFFPCRKP